MSVRTGIISNNNSLPPNSFSGFLIGAGSEDLDYRARAVIHQASGENGGLIAALNGKGEIAFYDNADSLKTLKVTSRQGITIARSTKEDIELRLSIQPKNGAYSIKLSAYNHKSGNFQSEATLEKIDPSRLAGNIAIIAKDGADSSGASFWFTDWKGSGSKLQINEEHHFGPILSTLYTLSNRVLKMTVQFPPLAETDSQIVRLQIKEKDSKNWQIVAEEKMIVPGWTVTFRIPDWDDRKDWDYRVVYSIQGPRGKLLDFYYNGTILHNPVDKEEIVVAAFTGNSNTYGSFGKYYSFTKNRLWFPHSDLVERVRTFKPDLLVFTGDQVYPRPTIPDHSGKFSSYLDYLYKWYMFCWAYRDLTRDVPTVCMSDDHDVFHGNLWGQEA